MNGETINRAGYAGKTTAVNPKGTNAVANFSSVGEDEVSRIEVSAKRIIFN